MTDLTPDLNNISLERWDHAVFRQNDLHVDVLRLDKIHPEISGNKWFKLKYYLENAKKEKKSLLISFGGAYSNHLLALAAAARLNGFSSAGYIRGEGPDRLSHTLQLAKEYGMELRFLSRSEYDLKKKSILLGNWEENDQNSFLIPEGGAGIEGIRGTEEILFLLPLRSFSHICTAVGTGTTMAGLMNSTGPGQKVIGISVLKGTRNLEPIDISWIRTGVNPAKIQMVHEYHFGGYAKYTPSLIDFMNQTFAESGIPTDFVYTGKLFFSVIRLAVMQLFPPSSRVLVLHTGGLQGNLSLTPGLLGY